LASKLAQLGAGKKKANRGRLAFWCCHWIGGAGGNRTRVRQQSLCRSTCLAVSIDLGSSSPTGRTLVPIP